MNNELLFAGEDDNPEVFETVDGEGPLVGKPSIFIRLFGCNLRCGMFASADSPYGCDSYISWSKKHRVSFEELDKIFEERNYVEKFRGGTYLKVSGGEPTLRQQPILDYIAYFSEKYGFIPRIDVETNCTITPVADWQEKYNATFTVSPKLSTNGDAIEKTYKPETIQWHVDHMSSFKFVVTRSEDIDEIWTKFVTPFNIPKHRIWLMPCCGSRAEHIERAPAVVEYAKALGVNFSPRLHLLLWDLALRV